MKRRDLSLALFAVPLAATSARAQGVASSAPRGGVIAAAVHYGNYTKDTAPDATSRLILSNPLERLYGGPEVTGDKNAAMHATFPQIIEQNFARLNGSHMEAMVNGLSDHELSDLAQLYVNATSDIRSPKRLLHVMAHRLSPPHLGRVSRHFGFADVYEAINSHAPGKRNDFIVASNPNFRAPMVGGNSVGPASAFAPRKLMTTAYRLNLDRPRMIRTAGFGRFLNMSPYEIYLDFRTAPVGALGVTGSLWEASVVMSSTLLWAYGTGYTIGEYVVKPLIETYAPDLYNRIGGLVSNIVDSLSSSWVRGTDVQGTVQRETAPTFECTSLQMDSFRGFGGDYGAADSWYYSSSGGGGCGIRTHCYPVAAY